MDYWQKLNQVDIKNKDFFVKVFRRVLDKVKTEKYIFEEGIIEKEKYFLVNEKKSKSNYFIYIIPKKIMELFKEIKAEKPNEFLGFTVLAGKINGHNIRISCFGIPCNILAKSIIDK